LKVVEKTLHANAADPEEREEAQQEGCCAMSTFTHEEPRDKVETVGFAFGPLARFYATFYESQIGHAKRVLEYYRSLLDRLGGEKEDFHSFVLYSALEAPDAQAKAWALRYTAGGLAPMD
jgi:hypothetical protein